MGIERRPSIHRMVILDHKQFRAALRHLGWTQAELARRLHLGSKNTVSRWLAPGGHIPGPVRAYLELALKVMELTKALAAAPKA